MAIEEFLRYFSPATVGRVIADDAESAAARWTAASGSCSPSRPPTGTPIDFDRPDEVVLDRQHNRHIAFGVGIHRCIGSNLARMETEVALAGWLRRFPRFELAGDLADIRWSNGAVRGPHIPCACPHLGPRGAR